MPTKQDKLDAFQGRFQISESIQGDGPLNVLLLDDLFDTGASAEAACTALRSRRNLCAKRVTVYCSGSQPRNNIGIWPVHHVTNNHAPGSRSLYTAKDVETAQAADYARPMMTLARA